MIQYINIKLLLDNLLLHPLLQDLSFEKAVNYTVEFMRIVGMPEIFLDKIATIEVKLHKALLPCDFLNMTQVKDNKERVFRYTTDSFHMDFDDKRAYNRCCEYIGEGDLTYKLQGNFIYTSVKDTKLIIAYLALALDEDGFPLIPDNSSFIKALELYIKKQLFTILFDLGKISLQVLNNVQQEYAWYVGQAQSDLVRPTIDQMLSITNIINNLIPRVTDHSKGFINSGSREYLRVK